MSSLFLYFQSPVFFILLLIEIGLCVHIARSGQNYYWMFIILIFPGIGALIYFLVELLPGITSGSKGRALKGGLKKALNPNKELNDARRALEIAPTVANRIRLAHLLIDREAWDEVIETLKPALTDFFASDPVILEGLAVAYYNKKDYAQALVHIQQMMENKDWPVKAPIELLRARIYEMQNQPAPAEEIYALLAKTASGEEAKVAYAQFLVKQNRADEAKPILADIVKRSGFMSAHARKMEEEWIMAAKRELGKIS